MFERYTKGARRVILNARQEAQHYGSTRIETQHLLMGILAEEKAATVFIGDQPVTVQSLRTELEDRTQMGTASAAVEEIPLSAECTQILTLAVDEAKRLGSWRIGLGHFLLGILRLDDCVAAEILRLHGGSLLRMRLEAERWFA